MGGSTPMHEDPASAPDGGGYPEPPRHVGAQPRRQRPGWMVALAMLAVYVVGGVIAHRVRAALPVATFAAYAVAEVGGLLFILRYMRTDWRQHPWGRHVMAFMVCLESLFTLALSRRVLGDWPGLEEALFLASWTFAGIVWWRWWLQRTGDRQARNRISPPN